MSLFGPFERAAMSAIAPLLGDKRTYSSQFRNDVDDPNRTLP